MRSNPRVVFAVLLLLLSSALASDQTSRKNILEKPVQVDLLMTKHVLGRDESWDFKTQLKFGSQTLLVDTEELVFNYKVSLSHDLKVTGWKDGYLFIPVNCSGCNAFRGNREKVFKIVSDKLIFVGETVADYQMGMPGTSYKDGYFLDVYDKLEREWFTSHAHDPIFDLVLLDNHDRFEVDLERTWSKNYRQYCMNLKTVNDRITESSTKIALGYEPPLDEDEDVTQAALENVVLAKYCKKQDAVEKMLSLMKKLYTKSAYQKFETRVFSQVVPGEVMSWKSVDR